MSLDISLLKDEVCYICKCREKPFYSMPKHYGSKLRWKEILNIPDDIFQHANKIKICKIHFEKEYLGTKRLKLGANPTLHLDFLEIPDTGLKTRSYNIGKTCSVPACESNDNDQSLTFFRVPAKSSLCLKWLAILKITVFRKSMFVCNLHFDEKYWSYNVIPEDILPNLPFNSPTVEVCNEAENDCPSDEDDCSETKRIKLEDLRDNQKPESIQQVIKVENEDGTFLFDPNL